MPIGAFISSREIMSSLSDDPPLGHITTFGGHPVCCASAHATLEVLIEEELPGKVKEKEELFRALLDHPSIKEVRSKGLLIAVDLGTGEFNRKAIDECIKRGVITDWFLFCDHAMRIAPPLTISANEIEDACSTILEALDAAVKA